MGMHPRRLRPILGALMVVALAMAMTLGLSVHQVGRQRDAVAAIERSGGWVIHESPNNPGARLDLRALPPWRRWLVDRLGIDHFGRVIMVHLGNGTDADLAHLAGSKALNTLDLSGIKVTDAGLAHLAGLTAMKELRLNNLALAGPGLAHLRRMAALDDLQLSGTGVTDAALVHLAGLTRIRSLRLDGTPIAGPGLAHLRGMVALRYLDLRRTRVADLKSLPPLAGLELLKLDETPIDDAGLLRPPAFAKLSALFLDATRVTDAGLPSLAELPAIGVVGLNKTGVTDAGLSGTAWPKSLRGIFAVDTAITRAAGAAFEAARPGTFVSLDPFNLTPSLVLPDPPFMHK